LLAKSVIGLEGVARLVALKIMKRGIGIVFDLISYKIVEGYSLFPVGL